MDGCKAPRKIFEAVPTFGNMIANSHAYKLFKVGVKQKYLENVTFSRLLTFKIVFNE